jgi:hypothetical protein
MTVSHGAEALNFSRSARPYRPSACRAPKNRYTRGGRGNPAICSAMAFTGARPVLPATSSTSRPDLASAVIVPTGGPSRSREPAASPPTRAMLSSPPGTVRTWKSSVPSGRGALAIE